MGDVISLVEHRTARRDQARSGRIGRPRAVCYFDLSTPATYLAAERVDGWFPGVTWRPALRQALHGGDPLAEQATRERDVVVAEQRAADLRMPLVWPDPFPPDGRAAMRVASLAAELGRGGAFVLAASRLAFCGGFDLDDPEVIAEAAAAAGLRLEDALAAVKDVTRDGPMEEEGRRLLAHGADVLPAVQVRRALFCGEDRLSEAAAAWRAAGREPRRVRRTGT